MPITQIRGPAVDIPSRGATGAAGSNGVFSNVRLAKVAAYTVDTTDKGKTVDLGGSSVYDLTFTATGDYATDFAVHVVNSGTTAKRLVLTGGTNHWLPPGDAAQVLVVGSDWYYIGPTELVPADFGAAGDGSTDDTAAFTALEAAVTDAEVDLGGLVYLIDDFATGNDYFNGAMSVDGQVQWFTARRGTPVENALWAGHFQSAQSGGIFQARAWRIPAIDGTSLAREGGEAGVNIYHVTGQREPGGMRILRRANDESDAPAIVVLCLTAAETLPLRGLSCVLSLDGLHGEGYEGGASTVQVACNRGSEVPIVSLDGTFPWDEVLAEIEVTLDEELAAVDEPWWVRFTVPPRATQIAVRITVPWPAVASGSDDWVQFEPVHVHPGIRPRPMIPRTAADILPLARSRVRSTYPYGTPQRAKTEAGMKRGVSVSTTALKAVVMEFDLTGMAWPATVWTASPIGTNPTSPWIHDLDAAADVSARYYGVSNDGAVSIVNGGTVTAGRMFAAHVVAQSWA